MKIAACFLTMAFLLGCLGGSVSAKDETDLDLTTKILAILEECKTVTPGTTRANLLKTFTGGGGVSIAKERTFVHRRCPFIKVHVVFDVAPTTAEERPDDKVIKVSKPYLELGIVD